MLQQVSLLHNARPVQSCQYRVLWISIFGATFVSGLAKVKIEQEERNSRELYSRKSILLA